LCSSRLCRAVHFRKGTLWANFGSFFNISVSVCITLGYEAVPANGALAILHSAKQGRRQEEEAGSRKQQGGERGRQDTNTSTQHTSTWQW